MNFDKPPVAPAVPEKSDERHVIHPLENAHEVNRILEQGTPEELKILQNHYGLNQEQIDLFTHFAKLRYETHQEGNRKFHERILSDPEPTADEYGMAAYKEEIEPQVYEAVRSLRAKGYVTYESGFHGPDKQRIGFENTTLPNDPQLSPETTSLLDTFGLKVSFLPDAIEFSYSKKLSLEELRTTWDAVASDIPDLGHPADPVSSTGAAKNFTKRVQNIKANPRAFID